MEIIKPQLIEKRSMEIIEQEIGKIDCSPEELAIIKRVIHATAEPELINFIEISPDAIEAAFRTVKKGFDLVTDVSMLKAGINKRKLRKFGGRINCYITDDDVVSNAAEVGITRSMMAMRKAVMDKNNKIYLIGNAPTALFELINLIKEKKAEVDLIIGTPVGFVGAKESKEELIKLDIPFITVRGRKGGSPVAAAIMNALLYMLKE